MLHIVLNEMQIDFFDIKNTLKNTLVNIIDHFIDHTATSYCHNLYIFHTVRCELRGLGLNICVGIRKQHCTVVRLIRKKKAPVCLEGKCMKRCTHHTGHCTSLWWQCYDLGFI